MLLVDSDNYRFRVYNANTGLAIGEEKGFGNAFVRHAEFTPHGEQIVMCFLAHIEGTRDNGARTRNARIAAITPRTGGDPPFGGTRFSKRGGRANDPTLARYVLGPL